MFEKSTNLLSKWKGKWSGNELENDFVIASILGTEVNLRNLKNFRTLRNLMNLNHNLNTFGNLDLNMDMNVNMLDQLILLVQLPDVSVINTNGNS